MDKRNMVYLLLVENRDEDFVVQCPADVDVREGDLAEAGIADAVVMGRVVKVLYTEVDSPEYIIIEKMCGGLPDTLRRVYRQVWEAEEHDEDQDCD